MFLDRPKTSRDAGSGTCCSFIGHNGKDRLRPDMGLGRAGYGSASGLLIIPGIPEVIPIPVQISG